MRARNLSCLIASLALCISYFVFPGTVHADTYQIYLVGDLQIERVYGLAVDGTVLEQGDCSTEGSPTPCYQTVVDGVTTAGGLTVAPNLTYDDGTPCTPTDPPPGMTVLAGVCNNGRELFETNSGGVYTGPDALNDLVTPYGGVFAINANGDFVFRYYQDGIDEAIDLTTQTPEPGGMALLGASVVMAAEWLRRRRAWRAEA
jgi:hypothetical protein